MQNEQQDDQARQRLLQRAHAAERRVQELLLEVSHKQSHLIH